MKSFAWTLAFGLFLVCFFEYFSAAMSLLSASSDVDVAIGVTMILLIFPFGYGMYKTFHKHNVKFKL